MTSGSGKVKYTLRIQRRRELAIFVVRDIVKLAGAFSSVTARLFDTGIERTSKKARRSSQLAVLLLVARSS